MCHFHTVLWGCCGEIKSVEGDDCPQWYNEELCKITNSSDTEMGECYKCMKERQAHEAAIFWGLIKEDAAKEEGSRR